MKKVGRYDVIDELGRGAMGIVYKASDPTIGRLVALKVLTLDSSTDEGTHSPQEMFMREVRAAGRLTHPSIVTIHDAFEDTETKSSCIVMELVAGKTLENILLAGPAMSVEDTLALIRQVAEGLDYAHRNQVVHRDMKPANILVNEDGHPKITDFGIAKVLAREGVARTIGVMGTPSYMSPEQVKGAEIDARSDLFSLGIILFLMLTGQKPFTGDTASVMFKIVYEEPPLPSTVNPQLTAAHDYVSLRCLAKDRNKRYSSARELVNDLDDLQHGRPPRSRQVAAPPPPPAPVAPAQAEQTLVTTIPMLSASAPNPQPAPVAPVPVAPPAPVAAPTPAAAPAPVSRPRPVAAPMPAAIDAPPSMANPAPVMPVEDEAPIDAETPIPKRGKSSALTAVLGVIVVLLLAAAGFGYMKYHQIMTTQTPPPQIALLPPPSVPPDLAPVEPVAPPAAGEVKPVVRKPKPVVTPPPVAPTPPPAPPPQTTIAVLPPPKPVITPPSAEDIARAQAAKFTSVAHVIQVQCQYDLKEANYMFTGGGQTLFQGGFKGKKKGGVLGIKGAYEGSFARTITVPAGVTEILVHVVSKDGSTDLSKVTTLGGPGGFVPTLNVNVTKDQITTVWQNPSKPKP